ncbi:MAG TPA: Rieske (2Fe-2S) protein [Ktedonobacterales bacterium]
MSLLSDSTSRDANDMTVTVDDEPTAPPTPDRIENLSETLQQGVKAIIGSNRKPPRRFKSLLHGSWLHHPLHPAITDIPIGAWLLAACFDVLWLVAPAANAWAARGAEALVLVGVVAALAAAVTGMADWSDSYGAERRVGLYHGALNLLAEVLYVVSAMLRFRVGSGEAVAGAVIGFAGLAAVLVAAYLGGDMVFGKGTGVNHTAWEAAGEDYEPVLPVGALQEKRLQRVLVANVPVVIMRVGDCYAAIAATCSHAGGPLDEGELQEDGRHGAVVQCPWHGSRFRMRDGNVLTGPATVAQPRYDVRVRNGQIELKRASGR